jgi:hypothetical protein
VFDFNSTAAELARRVALTRDRTALGALADLFDEHGHPVAPLLRRAFAEGHEIGVGPGEYPTAREGATTGVLAKSFYDGDFGQHVTPLVMLHFHRGRDGGGHEATLGFINGEYPTPTVRDRDAHVRLPVTHAEMVTAADGLPPYANGPRHAEQIAEFRDRVHSSSESHRYARELDAALGG